MTSEDNVVADDLEAFRRYRKSRDRGLRNELVEEHQGLAYYLANGYANRGVELDDLRQIAVVGLVKAVERFDPERGVTFATFARPFIVGEMRHHFRDEAWELRVPRSIKENAQRVRSAIESLRAAAGAEPHVEDVARETDLTVDEVLEAMDAARSTRTRRFEEAGPGVAPPEHLHPPADEPGFLDVEGRALISALVDQLDDREQAIVHARFVEERSQSDIAEELGISQVHVSRLLRQIIARLREHVTDGSETA
ncbi:MAG: sigma-70 family RNA polymerase sigma factor [Nitriliruptorales bacterium]|nr:sigma-70 family RNA polymerase sigma factor [Nitriliruptorales bacterium]